MASECVVSRIPSTVMSMLGLICENWLKVIEQQLYWGKGNSKCHNIISTSSYIQLDWSRHYINLLKY